MMIIKGLNHITLAVSDLETSFTFYKEALGYQPLQCAAKIEAACDRLLTKLQFLKQPWFS